MEGRASKKRGVPPEGSSQEEKTPGIFRKTLNFHLPVIPQEMVKQLAEASKVSEGIVQGGIALKQGLADNLLKEAY